MSKPPKGSMNTIINREITVSSEARRIASGWNQTTTAYPRHMCVHQLFEEQAERRPNAVALQFQNVQMSYGELNRRANQVAHRLRKLGVGPDVLVGAMVERSLDMVVALLGILKAGGAFVPIDANYPEERRAFMVADTKTPVILAQEAVVKSLGANWSAARTLFLDRDAEEISRQSTENPANLTAADNLAYVMYTSGSTGQPKGVMVEHRAIVRLVRNTNYLRLDESEVFLQFSPISFDASTLEIWAPLLNGGSLAIMPPNVQSLGEIGAAITRHGVTSAWLTAGLFNVIVEQRLEDLRPLRQLLVGGDALSSVHVKKAMAGLPNCQLINGYGPTEGTTFSCCHAITLADADLSSIPIGKPISNTQVYLINEKNELALVGESAELCIAGDGLARGYLNQPELTASKFVNQKFEPGSTRLYKTGDLARYRADGVIEFLGRADGQVKISGYRIELGEIEAVLMQHALVRSAVVLARNDGPGEKKLVAYIVANGESRNAEGIREFLQSKLPVYMVPSAFVLLRELPLSPNGKVDRAALPAPGENSSAESGMISAQSELEQKIVEIWTKALGVKQVGLQDNFFDIGGDSLQLLAVHAEMQRVFDPNLEITVLFEYTTVRSLAQHLAGGNVSSAMQEAHQRAQKQQSAWAKFKPSRA